MLSNLFVQQYLGTTRTYYAVLASDDTIGVNTMSLPS